MSENNSKSNHNDYCKFCGNKISVELSKKIKANKENVVCELCGCQLLLITNISKEENRGTELITEIKKEHQEEIREDLKELYSLNIYSADREKFGYYLTVFASRSIYNIIKQSNLGINITDIHIEMISNSIMGEIINNKVDNEWLAEFKPIKKKIKKFYKELQSELSLNIALQDVFLEFFRLLTKIIIKLINKKDYNELQVIEYDIAEYLIKRDLFVSNIRLTVPFRYNLKICLSRLIYLKIKDIANKNKLKFRQLKLSNIEYRNISDEIMKCLTTHNEIINKFLGELEGIKLNDFNEFYEYLCLELKSDNLFAESFNYYLRWLIGHIHNIVSGKYKWRELSHFDRIIGSKLAQLINVKVDFQSFSQNDNLNSLESIKSKTKSIQEENWKELIILKLDQLITLSFKEKSQINDLVQKEKLSKKEKERIISLLSKLKNEELIVLFGKSFEEHAKNYVQWGTGWYEDPGLKIIVLTKYFSIYNKWYKDITQRLDFDFRTARLGKSRKVISLYFFEILNNTETDLYKIILHLEEIDISKIVLRLREIITNTNKEISRQLTLKEKDLLKQLTTREIETLQDMVDNYSDTFTKYFTDLVDIVKLMIISNKSHEIIGADFSLQHFLKFLTKNTNINLFMTYRSFYNAVNDIFRFLGTTKYSYLLPIQARKDSSKDAHDNDTIFGSRIKLFLMKYLYNGTYFDDKKGIAICPECKEEGLIINISVPRIRAKEFHHEDDRLEGYSIQELYKLFLDSRGDPYFLPKLIKKMELESVVLKCGCHHRTLRPSYAKNFRKLINWEEIPIEFPQNIFDLPADIIHMLIMVCVDNFHSLELLHNGREKVKEFDIMERKLDMKNHIIINLKKKYIIDIIYGGVCPICGEFNTRNHLNAFDISHLYELSELTEMTLEEKRERKRLRNLFKGSSCSELIREIVRQRAGYICHNCHAVFHKNTSLIAQIYDDQYIIDKILEDKANVSKKFEQNIIYETFLIKNPLKTEKKRYDPFMRYLIALYELSKTKYDGATRKDMQKHMNFKSDKNIVFETTNYSYKYVKIVSGTKHRPTRYYITDEGKKIVRLMYYFRDYYKNLIYEDDYGIRADNY